MKKLIFLLSFVVGILGDSQSQTLKIQPYLQDASPHSIHILWETDSMGESLVHWGLTDSLGMTATGMAENSSGTSVIHDVRLDSLDRFTKYYYRVQTGSTLSDIFTFKTPPFASDEEHFRILAMSDMQRDGAFPNKFEEIVEEGVLDYLEEELGGELIDNLALIMIPGDLVVNGNSYTQWEDQFFDPARNLLSHVPVYPVLGNHENNSTYYFKYFRMPANGTSGFEEHWWYKDYGNTRIVGLDSNSPFTNQEQLDWLELLLEETCSQDSIDFVFAQLHHPHKSELWTPGESDYTGEVITLLEEFTEGCGKPSLHFFGHTHGYSRGNSRDHRHLWINAATAGGAIDNWGEFPNFDYDEFSVSQDEYGFVLVEVSDGEDPEMLIKRISRGDQDVTLDNVLTDSMRLRLWTNEVSRPTALWPVEEEVAPECVVLEASDFFSSNVDVSHGQSHWQISAIEGEFSSPVAEHWENFENWYFEENTQADNDLRDQAMLGLEENSPYWWRVRYRDKELNWSEWSIPVGFTTGSSIAPPNLLINGGAEDSLSNWTVVEGIVESLTDGICNGISPHSGNRYFAVGGLCEESEQARCIQAVDVSMYADSIDAATYSVNFGGELSTYSGLDLPEMRLIYLDQNSVEVGASEVFSSQNPSWTSISVWDEIPEFTRVIQMELKGTRNSGVDNDSYFDDLFLRVGPVSEGCDEVISTLGDILFIPSLEVYPNPIKKRGTIQLPWGDYSRLELDVVNTLGQKVSCSFHREDDQLIFQMDDLPSGGYLFFVRNHDDLIGRGKFIKGIK